MRISKKESGEMKCTAYNKRFGISAGVFSQKHLYEFASLSPVRTAVKPPPTPSRRTLAEMHKGSFYRFRKIRPHSAEPQPENRPC